MRRTGPADQLIEWREKCLVYAGDSWLVEPDWPLERAWTSGCWTEGSPRPPSPEAYTRTSFPASARHRHHHKRVMHEPTPCAQLIFRFIRLSVIDRPSPFAVVVYTIRWQQIGQSERNFKCFIQPLSRTSTFLWRSDGVAAAVIVVLCGV